MPRHRLRFSKEGRAVYLSHLDLMRTMQRVFLRAGAELRHTEGFNPHPYISVALPLSVGTASGCELLDFELLSGPGLDELPGRMTAVMPQGITVHEAYEADTRLKEIVWLGLNGRWAYDGERDLPGLAGELDAFFSAPSIAVEKRTKKKAMARVDIAPMIHRLRFAAGEGGAIDVDAVLAAQNPSLNPELLVGALAQAAPALRPDFAEFRRLQVYTGDMRPFR